MEHIENYWVINALVAHFAVGGEGEAEGDTRKISGVLLSLPVPLFLQALFFQKLYEILGRQGSPRSELRSKI